MTSALVVWSATFRKAFAVAVIGGKRHRVAPTSARTRNTTSAADIRHLLAAWDHTCAARTGRCAVVAKCNIANEIGRHSAGHVERPVRRPASLCFFDPEPFRNVLRRFLYTDAEVLGGRFERSEFIFSIFGHVSLRSAPVLRLTRLPSQLWL